MSVHPPRMARDWNSHFTGAQLSTHRRSLPRDRWSQAKWPKGSDQAKLKVVEVVFPLDGPRGWEEEKTTLRQSNARVDCDVCNEKRERKERDQTGSSAQGS